MLEKLRAVGLICHKCNISPSSHIGQNFQRLFSRMSSNCVSPGSTNVEEVEKGQPADISHAKLFRFEKFVKMSELTSQEKLIHSLHVFALQEGQEIYKDPSTGYDVLTRLVHLRKGKCCGNACRHCPYGHQNVPKSMPKKRFNSAFYV